MKQTQRTALIVVLIAGASVLVLYWRFTAATAPARGTLPPNWMSPAVAGQVEPVDESQLYPVFINRPSGPPRVETGVLDEVGRPVSVSCTSCHANLQPNFQTRTSEQLTEFHQGLIFDHGNLSCLSCHNPNNYNTLRLADGSDIGFPDVHMMCAQCHAPQARDFERGAHGGMVGYWDRTRGPQVRKNCIDCHDPHAPAFPRMVPTFKPQDRFLNPPH